MYFKTVHLHSELIIRPLQKHQRKGINPFNRDDRVKYEEKMQKSAKDFLLQSKTQNSTKDLPSIKITYLESDQGTSRPKQLKEYRLSEEDFQNLDC